MTGPLKRSMLSFDYPVGNWVSIGHPAIPEVTAKLDFDFVLVDTEHTSMSLETVEHLVRAVDSAGTRTQTIVRVPSDDPNRIKRVLDIGVAGIMIPMVESAESARDVVNAVRYPPDGLRGVAGGRASAYGLDFPRYFEEANGSILVIAQIESRRGIENADAIATVDGIDALFIGPGDLSGALGVFGEWSAEVFTDAVDRVIAVGNDTETPVGTLTVDPARIASSVERGFDYLIVGKDISYVAGSSRDAKERYEHAVDGVARPPAVTDE